MTLPTVTKFFCCINLEIGVAIVGFWAILLNLLNLGLTTALWIISRNEKLIDEITRQFPYFRDYLEELPHFMLQVWYMLFAIFWNLAFIFAAYKMVKSRSSRNHKDLLPYMTLTIIGYILSIILQFSILNIEANFISVIITIVIVTAFDLYIFICIYSLYKILENENYGRERLLDDGYGNQTQYQSISNP